MIRVFIDGAAGTTGLRIHERLRVRDDISLIELDEHDRKLAACRKDALNSCDIAVLCLPDAAAREAVSLISNPAVRIIDASSAHRTAPGWVYGFPELSDDGAARIASASRVAVPGCHASGFVALVAPLTARSIIPAQARLSCFSLTGYSGGGKQMIAAYEGDEGSYNAPRAYALSQQHKHLAEMQGVCGLRTAPIFMPVVDDYYSGMLVTVPLFADDLASGYAAHDIAALFRERYRGSVVTFCDDLAEDGFIAANALSGTDGMQVSVGGNEERILLLARFDNLGKGASGAAVECFNLMTGNPRTSGLTL